MFCLLFSVSGFLLVFTSLTIGFTLGSQSLSSALVEARAQLKLGTALHLILTKFSQVLWIIMYICLLQML